MPGASSGEIDRKRSTRLASGPSRKSVTSGGIALNKLVSPPSRPISMPTVRRPFSQAPAGFGGKMTRHFPASAPSTNDSTTLGQADFFAAVPFPGAFTFAFSFSSPGPASTADGFFSCGWMNSKPTANTCAQIIPSRRAGGQTHKFSMSVSDVTFSLARYAFPRSRTTPSKSPPS